MQALALLWATLTVGALSAGSALAEPVIIGNPQNSASADLEKVRRVYLGKERSLDGTTPVQPIDVDEKSAVRAVFLDKVLEKSENELRQYWSRLVFTGKATPPRSVGSDEAVKTWVAQNKDAIGCIDSALVDKTVKMLVPVK